MQTIQTKYLGPTNFRGARVKAFAQAGSITVPWDYALNAAENHRNAAEAFAKKWEWSGKWVGGALADGTGNVYVNVGSADRTLDLFEV